MNGLSKDEIKHLVDIERFHVDGYLSAMSAAERESREESSFLIPRDQFLLASGHIDTTAIALAAMPAPLVVLGGEPGIGKTYHFDSLKDRMIHIQYEPMDFDRLYDIPSYGHRLDEPYVGERRVHKGRKAKARINNRLARKARRAGR